MQETIANKTSSATSDWTDASSAPKEVFHVPDTIETSTLGSTMKLQMSKQKRKSPKQDPSHPVVVDRPAIRERFPC
jgi:hypothetical protein